MVVPPWSVGAAMRLSSSSEACGGGGSDGGRDFLDLSAVAAAPPTLPPPGTRLLPFDADEVFLLLLVKFAWFLDADIITPPPSLLLLPFALPLPLVNSNAASEVEPSSLLVVLLGIELDVSSEVETDPLLLLLLPPDVAVAVVVGWVEGGVLGASASSAF